MGQQRQQIVSDAPGEAQGGLGIGLQVCACFQCGRPATHSLYSQCARPGASQANLTVPSQPNVCPRGQPFAELVTVIPATNGNTLMHMLMPPALPYPWQMNEAGHHKLYYMAPGSAAFSSGSLILGDVIVAVDATLIAHMDAQSVSC